MKAWTLYEKFDVRNAERPSGGAWRERAILGDIEALRWVLRQDWERGYDHFIEHLATEMPMYFVNLHLLLRAYGDGTIRLQEAALAKWSSVMQPHLAGREYLPAHWCAWIGCMNAVVERIRYRSTRDAAFVRVHVLREAFRQREPLFVRFLEAVCQRRINRADLYYRIAVASIQRVFRTAEDITPRKLLAIAPYLAGLLKYMERATYHIEDRLLFESAWSAWRLRGEEDLITGLVSHVNAQEQDPHHVSFEAMRDMGAFLLRELMRKEGYPRETSYELPGV